jgi:hypothetical protein
MQILSEVKNLLLEERRNQDKLTKQVTKAINSLKDQLEINSVTPSNRLSNGLIVRFDKEEGIKQKIDVIVKALSKIPGVDISNNKVSRYGDKHPVTDISYIDDSGKVRLAYRHKISSRKGFVLEELILYAITNAISDKLKDRLDLPPEAKDSDVINAVKSEDFSELYMIALKAKNLLFSKIGSIVGAETVGSSNTKADIVIKDRHDQQYGVSIKLSFDREIRFEYNKNLGYGDEKDNPVSSKSGFPWWFIGRRIFLKNLKAAGKYLGKEYMPEKSNVSCPAWLKQAKEKNSKIYRDSMSQTYALIRTILTRNLQNKPLEELVEMVNESHVGSKDEVSKYKKFFRLTYDTEGLNLEEVVNQKVDSNMLDVKPADVIRVDGSKIIIDIPGMSPLTINSVKFHSNMLSSNKEDLKIKTR